MVDCVRLVVVAFVIGRGCYRPLGRFLKVKEPIEDVCLDQLLDHTMR